MRIKIYNTMGWIFPTLDDETERKVEELVDAGYTFFVDKFINTNRIYTVEKYGQVQAAAICPEGPPPEEMLKRLIDVGHALLTHPSKTVHVIVATNLIAEADHVLPDDQAAV
jgi:hypothetical protein